MLLEKNTKKKLLASFFIFLFFRGIWQSIRDDSFLGYSSKPSWDWILQPLWYMTNKKLEDFT